MWILHAFIYNTKGADPEKYGLKITEDGTVETHTHPYTNKILYVLLKKQAAVKRQEFASVYDVFKKVGLPVLNDSPEFKKYLLENYFGLKDPSKPQINYLNILDLWKSYQRYFI